MNLYRIILVDDEEEVRKGIIRKIDWETLGFQVVGDAENGQDALEKIEQLEPNVVMTDIRMPYMDGLTLTSWIRQKYPSVKVLIFSGFDDFEYAQQAIKLNVTEYILKPVNVEELTQILDRVRENLDQEIEQRRDVDRFRESYLNSLPILRELFLNDMVRGNMPAEDYCRFTAFNSAVGITLIASVDGEKKQTSLIDLLGDICKEIKRILQVTVTIGIGYFCMDLEQLPAAYQSAVDALGYQEIVGTGNIIYINDMEPVSRGKLQLETRDEADLIAAVKFGTREKIEAAARSFASRMESARVHMRQQQVYQMSIINCLIRLMQQQDLDLGAMFGTDEMYGKVIYGNMKPEEFASVITEVGCRMNEAMNRERDKTAKKVILEAKQYILDHYQDPELSVDVMCRQLHMSPAYFSTVFKRETGQTYIAYLTEVRLDKAVELLNTTDDKTYVIAQKVGYQEQNYFSYVFKKRFGISPTKFRGSQH